MLNSPNYNGVENMNVAIDARYDEQTEHMILFDFKGKRTQFRMYMLTNKPNKSEFPTSL